MKNIIAAFIFTFVCLVTVNTIYGAEEENLLPSPQLVTDAWMFITAFKADPKELKKLLPPGLEPNPENQVVMNMYAIPDPNQTSGFGAYTLTYLTVELKDQDSYVRDSDVTYPGRYFVYYFNSSPLMREFTKKIGIPAQEGFTTTTVKDGKLTAVLKVDEKPFIEVTADVGSELGNFSGGHLNYFGKIAAKDSSSKNQIVKYPIPWSGGTVDISNVNIKFKAPRKNPLSKLKPVQKPTWAIWTNSSFVYPQYQVVSEY
ncbi:MAG: acetoacetate decarboxylase family protein [Thermodesulfobacteriota bacterium]